jgi:hypothetical protein
MDQRLAEDPEYVFIVPTVDQAVFQVHSFQGSPTVYEVKIDWAKGLAGHVTGCTCPNFLQYSKCCKHIALVTIELPHTVFRQAGHWNFRDQPALDDPAIEDTPVMTITAEPVSTLVFKSLMHQLNNVLNVLDDKRSITNEEEVLGAMKQALELCKLHVPVLAEHSLNNKRRRQR